MPIDEKKNLLPPYKCGKRDIPAGLSKNTNLHKDQRYLHLTNENDLGKNRTSGKVSKSILFSKKTGWIVNVIFNFKSGLLAA